MKTLFYTKILLSIFVMFIFGACGSDHTDNNSSSPQVPSKSNENAPIITLKGKNPFYCQNGHKYVEPGATVLDDINGDVQVHISGNVDSFKIGTYYITYTAEDFDGNSATINRKVIVEPIIHHGVTYKPVISPYTKKIWLDRNIGASEVCHSESYINFFFACHGDTYQWGRNTDGHEQLESATTSQKGQSITDSGSKFVISHNDWTSSTHRGENWRATDGRSVCPKHYRVPTVEELKLETKNIKIYDMSHFLKLGTSGERYGADGYENQYGGSDRAGFSIKLWTNTVTDKQTYILHMSPYATTPSFELSNRSNGHPVRCIQN